MMNLMLMEVLIVQNGLMILEMEAMVGEMVNLNIIQIEQKMLLLKMAY